MLWRILFPWVRCDLIKNYPIIRYHKDCGFSKSVLVATVKNVSKPSQQNNEAKNNFKNERATARDIHGFRKTSERILSLWIRQIQQNFIRRNRALSYQVFGTSHNELEGRRGVHVITSFSKHNAWFYIYSFSRMMIKWPVCLSFCLSAL